MVGTQRGETLQLDSRCDNVIYCQRLVQYVPNTEKFAVLDKLLAKLYKLLIAGETYLLRAIGGSCGNIC